MEFEDLSEGNPPYSRLEATEKFRAAVEFGPQIFEWRGKGKNQVLLWVEVALKYSEFETGHHKILVMDDEEQLRTITKLMLTRMGFDVVLAKDGVEAIQLYTDSLYSQAPFDLIIMDLTIPGGMGGKEAASKILEVNSDAKIIVASGYSNDPVMARYKEFGFCAAIEKPYLFQEIKKTIAPLLA